MTLYREAPGPFPVWAGEAIDGITHPLNIEQMWSAQDLEAIGLWRDDMIAAAGEVPEGKIVTATTVERVGEVVQFVHTLEDAPVYVPETPQLYALATMTIADEAVSAIVPSTQLAGGFRLDTGIYWVFFAEPQPNTQYQVLCFNHASKVYVSERYEDYFVITAEADGVPTDPGNICIQITRVV
ncbi:MAG: hypothetical protein LCH99_15500 [Proteobacteria bacterium]|nr:hypothetical protein [Pseudomonadota bacterium]